MGKILSVSVAAYNLESMIRQCLDSFLDKDVLDRVEVLVTDDGSTDHTREIVAEYETKYPGSFKLIGSILLKCLRFWTIWKATISIWFAQAIAVWIMKQERKNWKCYSVQLWIKS